MPPIPNREKLAIVGSTMLEGNAEAQAIIDMVLDKYRPRVVVSGGARGIDTMAEVSAIKRGIATSIKRPKVMRWQGPGGFAERDQQIADECTRLVRIISSKTKTYGSGWTRDRARKQGKPTEQYIIKQ